MICSRSRPRRPNCFLASTAMLRPSAVSSASEASCAASASSCSVTPRRGMNRVAWRLPSVIVPVLSSSSTSTSPAASTARPDMAMTLAWLRRFMPAMPMADSSAPMVVGARQTNSATSTVRLIGLPLARRLRRCRSKRQQRGHDQQEDQRQGRQQDRQGDLVGRLLPLRPFDHRDHPIEKALARQRRDPDDQPVGDDPRAAGDGAAVAAAFADDRGAFAGDGAFVDRGDAFDRLRRRPESTSPASTITRSPTCRSVAGDFHGRPRSLRSVEILLGR